MCPHNPPGCWILYLVLLECQYLMRNSNTYAFQTYHTLNVNPKSKTDPNANPIPKPVAYFSRKAVKLQERPVLSVKHLHYSKYINLSYIQKLQLTYQIQHHVSAEIQKYHALQHWHETNWIVLEHSTDLPFHWLTTTTKSVSRLHLFQCSRLHTVLNLCNIHPIWYSTSDSARNRTNFIITRSYRWCALIMRLSLSLQRYQ